MAWLLLADAIGGFLLGGRQMGLILLILMVFSTFVQAETVDLNAIVIKSSRSNSTLATMNKAVSIISREDIKRSPAKSLPELLASKAGVYGVQYGNVKSSQVDIRGFGETALSNVVFLVDGRRLNQIDTSQDWAQIDVNTIDHIEIIKGSGTVLYGDNASGGVINVITKKGKKNTKPSVALSSTFSRYQTHNHSFELNGGVTKASYHLDYAHDESTGYRANSNYWANSMNARVGIDVTDDFGVDLAQGYHLDRYQLPGALFINNIHDFGRTGVRASLNNDRGTTSDMHVDITPHLKLDLGPSEGELSLFTTAHKRDNKFETGSSVYFTNYSTDTYEFQPKLTITTPLSDVLSNKSTGGYDYFYSKNRRYSGYIKDYGFGSFPPDLLYASKVTHGVYLLDELTIDEKWLVNAGMRGSWAQYVFDQKAVIAGKTVKKPATQGIEGGLGYKYNEASKVYVNVNKSYRLPAIDEFFQNYYDFGAGVSGGLNPDLTYQKGNQIEWGIKDNTIKNLKWGLNFFAAQFKDEIYYDPTGGSSGFGANSNYNGRSRHYGVETEASVSLVDGKVEPFFNTTFQTAEFRGGKYAGSKIPFVPDQMANAGVSFKPVERLRTTVSVNEIGKRFAISDMTNTQPKLKKYNTVDWSTAYNFDNVECWVSLRNVFDQKYYAYGGYSSFEGKIGYYPAPGRDVSVGVKVKF